jgi:hypothetical protein
VDDAPQHWMAVNTASSGMVLTNAGKHAPGVNVDVRVDWSQDPYVSACAMQHRAGPSQLTGEVCPAWWNGRDPWRHSAQRHDGAAFTVEARVACCEGWRA